MGDNTLCFNDYDNRLLPENRSWSNRLYSTTQNGDSAEENKQWHYNNHDDRTSHSKFLDGHPAVPIERWHVTDDRVHEV